MIPVIALAAALLPAASMAQEQTVTWYDVEVIVFRHVDARTNETFPPDAGTPDIENARAVFPPRAPEAEEELNAALAVALDEQAPRNPDTPTPYVPLDASARQLNGIFGSLQRSSRYEPLVHVAWTQPPLDRNQAPYLRLTLPGALNVESEPEADNDWMASERPLLGRVTDERSGFGEQAMPEDLPEFLEEEERTTFARPLDGRVQLSVSRYLHFDLDLLYLPDNIDPALLGDAVVPTRQWAEDEKRRRDQRRRDILDALARGNITIEEAEILSLEPPQAVFEGFRLNHFRRLRSREVHYFDHPVFGAIVTVTPRQVSARLLEADPMRGTMQ